MAREEKLNPEQIVVPQGYKVNWISNPSYPNKSLDEELQVLTWDREFVETWYWLVYIGKDPNDYREPLNRKKIWKSYPEGRSYHTYWIPSPNNWRDATDTEIKLIKREFKKGLARRLKQSYMKIPTYQEGKEKGKITGAIDIPISYIYKLSNGLIMKRWRSNE